MEPGNYGDIFASVTENGNATLNDSVFYPTGIIMPPDGAIILGFSDGPQRVTNISFNVSSNVISATFDFLYGDVSRTA